MVETPTENNLEEMSLFLTGESVLTAPWGSVRLEVSPDGMDVAFLEVVPTPSWRDPVTAAEIRMLLQENNITHGVVQGTLEEIVTGLAQDAGWTGYLVGAEGSPPEVPRGVEYTMFEEAKDIQLTSRDVMTIDGSVLVFSSIKNYLEQHHHPEELPELLAKVVSGGEVLVTRKPPLKGQPGSDIFGRPLAPPEFNEVLQGENVELIAGKSKFTSSFFGYVLVIDRKLSVLSPIVISDDNMTAWYVQFPQLAPWKSPLPMDLTLLLQDAGLEREMAGDLVEDCCQQIQRDKRPGWYVAARGKEPVAGVNGALLFEGTDPPSALRDDGSIDYRVLNLVKTTDANCLFARLSMPTEGTPGCTLLGEVLPAEPGVALRVDVKGNVRVEEDDDGEIRYYSETEGVIQYKNGQLLIEPLYKVSANVDFSTGNIDVDCCLTVGGNVCSDFKVKSTKDIIINGTVEPGAKIVAEGNLQVKGGIIGENTEVLVLGNLQAEYVQDAKIIVKGQALINQYAFSALIRCVGSLQVGPGSGERGGAIVGGTICSSAHIEAKSVGSPSNVRTSLVVEPAPHKLARLEQLNEKIMACESKITRIMRTLELEAIEPRLVKQLLENAKPKQRDLYVKILKQLNLLVKQQHDLAANKKRLKVTLSKDMRDMYVQVTKKFYANTKVRIGREMFQNRDDLGATQITHRHKELHIDSVKAASENVF